MYQAPESVTTMHEATMEPSEDAADGRPAPVGIKLGSTRTIVAESQDEGVQTHEALTCLATYNDVLTGEQRALR